MTSETTAACCPNCGARLNGSFGTNQREPHTWRRGQRPRFVNGRIRMPGGGRASKWWRVTTGRKKLPYCVHPAHQAQIDASRALADRRAALQRDGIEPRRGFLIAKPVK